MVVGELSRIVDSALLSLVRWWVVVRKGEQVRGGARGSKLLCQVPDRKNGKRDMDAWTLNAPWYHVQGNRDGICRATAMVPGVGDVILGCEPSGWIPWQEGPLCGRTLTSQCLVPPPTTTTTPTTQRPHVPEWRHAFGDAGQSPPAKFGVGATVNNPCSDLAKACVTCLASQFALHDRLHPH